MLQVRSVGSVPIAAQTVVGLVPGVPGSADAAGSHQVRSLLQHKPLWVLCQASQVQQMPQVLRSLLQHGPQWVYCQTSQVQQSAAQTPWVLCRAFQVQYMSPVLRSLCSPNHRALVPGGPSPRCVLWRLGCTRAVPLLRSGEGIKRVAEPKAGWPATTKNQVRSHEL